MSDGSILFDNDDVTEWSPGDRDVGIVTQHNTLFPTKRVRSNLLFPLWARGVDRAEAHARVKAEADANALANILDRWPATLSAGEQQLTQIARALIRRPKVFLMDEPLANLDPVARRRLRRELRSIQQGYGVTTIYVANRADEIMTMPDRLVVIEQGRVIQTGTPAAIYDAPGSLTAAGLTGELGTVSGTIVHDGNGLVLQNDGLAMRLLPGPVGAHAGEQVTLGVRHHDVRVAESGQLTCRAGALRYFGSTMVRELTCAAGTLCTIDHEIDEGSLVSVWLDRWQLYDRAGRVIDA